MKKIICSSQTNLDQFVIKLCLWMPLMVLIIFFGIPMVGIIWRSFLDDNTGQFGINNYNALLGSADIWHAVLNSLFLGAVTTGLTLIFGFLIAYGLECTSMPCKRFIASAISLPILAPSLVLGLGLIFLLGRNGIVGHILGIRMNIYGFWGLLIANTLYALPQAVLILKQALKSGDARQYEAANMLGASSWRQFVDITLPNARYGLLSAAFIVFTTTITDFGNAAVIGGDFSVLATEIYSQVSGQMKFGMGSVVGILLLIPAAVAIWIERSAMRCQERIGTQMVIPYLPNVSFLKDSFFFIINMLIALSVAAIVATVIAASFIRLWPYHFDLTFKHYDIDLAGGYSPLWTSIWVSLIAAIIGIMLLLLLTFGIRRQPGKSANLAMLLSSLPIGVPGLVLGLSYIFIFNSGAWPWGMLYGSIILLAICNYIHYHTQGYTTMMIGVRSIPASLEDAAEVLGSGTLRILWNIYIPALRLTLISVALFIFMRSMVTLSAVIFLITPSLSLSAVTVMRLDEAGFTSQAAAFSTCIMVIVATVAFLLKALTHKHK